MIAKFVHHRFSVADYLRMAEVGVLRESDHVELIDGEIRDMSPKNAWHRSTVSLLNEILVLRLAGRAVISPQNVVVLSDDTAPEPDLMVLRYRADRYQQANPTPVDVLIAIEVSDTTIAYDLEEKVPRYAAAGIPELWVVDAQERLIHQFCEPASGAYGSDREIRVGHFLESVAVPDLRLAAAEILDPA